MKTPRFFLALVAVAALLAGRATAASAQTPASLLDDARAQLEDLRPDSASALLVRALDRRANPSPGEQLRGWTLLGIAELMRGRQPIARQAFRRALERDANLRVDSLAYLHSDLRQVFATEKDAYRVENAANTDDAPNTMTVRLAADTIVSPIRGRYAFEVRPRRRARIIATITPYGNDNAEPLWADTSSANPNSWFGWNLRTPQGIIEPGRYTLQVVATEGGGRPAVMTTRTITVMRAAVDTLVPPGIPDDSLLPEYTMGRRSSSLLAGAALGAGAIAISSVLGNKDVNGGGSGSPARFVVAGAVSVASIVGFLNGKHERALPENVAANQDMRDRYARLQQDMLTENRRRLAGAPLRIRMEPVRMEGTRDE